MSTDLSEAVTRRPSAAPPAKRGRPSSHALTRGIRVLEALTGIEAGLPLGEIAARVEIPKPATYRALSELIELGYVRQLEENGNYMLSMRVVSLGQQHLASLRLVELAKPLLKQLADASGELARLGVIEGESLIWVARSRSDRGASLHIDSDDGRAANLSCSASAMAWLLTLPEERALELVAREGFDDVDAYGPNAPRSLDEYRGRLAEARARGVAAVFDTYEAGISGVATPVRTAPDGEAVAVLSVAGPSVRFTPGAIAEYSPLLLRLTAELGALFAGKAFT